MIAFGRYAPISMLVLGVLAGCGGGQDAKSPAERKLSAEQQQAVDAVKAAAERDQQLFQKGLDSEVRTDTARAQDVYRRPQDLLTLLRVQPGMVIIDASGSDTYMSEILAGLASSGVEIVRTGVDVNALAALDPGSVDAVFSYLSYHELLAKSVDRSAWLAAAQKALKPNGYLLVVDYAADPGAADRDARTLGRIDEQIVQQEAEAAGFDVEESNSMFRNSADDRRSVATASDPSGSADQFAIRFRKVPQ